MDSNLTSEDLTLHASLGIPADLLERARVRRVTDREARELLRAGTTAISPASSILTSIRTRADRSPTGSAAIIRNSRPVNRRASTSRPRRRAASVFSTRRQCCSTLAVPVLVESEKASLSLTAAALSAGRPVLPIALGGFGTGTAASARPRTRPARASMKWGRCQTWRM